MKRIKYLFFLLLCSCIWTSPDTDSKYLPLDDSSYPYANIPRIVIETNNFLQIRDTKTKLQARMQIYGEYEPETAILDLTVKGRGNSSFKAMPQYSIKLELEQKTPLLGMPANKDYALISNYADKTLLKNFITYKLGSWLSKDYFTPKSQLVELYFNRTYMGVYLFVETIKVSKKRVNIPKNDSSFLAEFDEKIKKDDLSIYTKSGKTINIHSPKNATTQSQELLKTHLDSIESFLSKRTFWEKENSLSDLIDIEAYLWYYWIQEFCANGDGQFYTSVYFTWVKGEPLRMGPIWDFDLAYNGHWILNKRKWLLRKIYWNKELFSDKDFVEISRKYWDNHIEQFKSLQDTVAYYGKKFSEAAANHFKKWPILNETDNSMLNSVFKDYGNAIDSLSNWIRDRIEWIELNK